MKKILLILSVMCLIPFFAQAQGTECRPVSQFEVTADYDDVTLNWQLPTSSEIKYYEGSPANEIGTLADNVLWMAFRIPASVLAEYPSTADYPFTLEKVKFIPTVTTGVHYQVDVYTADPNGPASGDFTATRVNSYTVTDAVADAFNYVSVGTEIDKTQDLIIAVKATGENLSTLRFTEEGAVNGYSNLISLDGVEFDYVYENSHSAPISWYICAVVDYPNEDGQKGWGDIEPIDNMNVYKPANVIASKSIPNVETVDHYIIYRDNVEIAQVDGGIFTYVDADLPHVTHTYTYGIVVAHNDNGVLCDSRVVEKNITLYFCVDDDNNISNIYGMANPEERTIAVYWTAPVNPNVLGYEVRCFNDNAGTCVKVAFTELTEYTLSGMEAGDYHFCVNAVYDGCASEDFCTSIINLPVECGYPVTELTAAQGVLNVKMVNVAWTAPFTTHLIEYYTINKYVPYSDVLIASYTTTGTEYADFDVEFYNSYDYEVVANYVDGCVSVPVATSAYVGLEPIANLVASTTSDGQITLTWDAPTQEGLTGYMITVNDETYTSETNTYINIYPAGSYYFQVYAVYSDQYYAIPVGINVVISGTEQYIINATVNPAEGGSVAGYGTYLNGQTALLTAVHAPEYAFINWTEDGVEVSNDEEYSFIVTGNRNLVANFLPLNVLWIGNYVAHSENNVEIAINLHNYIDDVYAFQFDIPLGELEYVDGSLAVTDRTNENFVVNTTLYENNTLRIVGYSMPPTAVPGTDGAIVTLEIVAHSEEVFPLTITDPVLSDLYGNILYCETRDGELAIDDVNIEAVTVPMEGGVTTGTGVYFTGEQVTVTVTPNEGYTFVDWLENGVIVASTPEYTFIAGADRVLIAVMSLNTYYISVTANPAEGGVVTGEGAYNHFETAVLTATPADGYMFTNWTENGLVVSDDAIYTFTVRGNRNLVAHFIGVNVLSIPTTLMGHVDQPATINVDLDNDVDLVYGFQFDIPLGDMTYVYGSIALTDRDDDSHHISAEVISGNVLRVIDYSMPPVPLAGTDGAICTFDVTAPVEGTFTLAIQNEVLTDMMGNVLYSETVDGLLTIEDVNIFVTADPIDGGTFTGNGVYYIGETVTLTATPNIGYAFLYWKEGETEYTDNPYIFAAGLDRSFVACFELVDYYITAIVNPDGFGTISGVDNPYHYGDVATLTATPASDEYAFDAWTENGVVVSQDETYSFTVTSDMVIVANFVYNNFLVVEDVESLPNVLVDIPVNLINHNDVVYGFQFDITIPDGLTFVGVEKSDRLSESHILMAMPIAGNVIRILDYAMPPEAISGTEGAICTIQVVATETGDYPMNIDATTAAISGIDGSLYHVTTVDGTLSVSQINITVSAIPEEGGTVTGGGAYIYGATVAVSASPEIGYSFVCWIEDGNIVSRNALYEFTATEDRDLVAYFLHNTYYVNVTVNPEGHGLVMGLDNPYYYGDVVTLTAVSVDENDYTFVNWTENGVEVSADKTYSFTLVSDRNLVANFANNNVISVESVTGLPGVVTDVPINLHNANDVVYGFQFDVTIPEGLTYVGIEKTYRLSDSHIIMAMPISDNVLRVLDYSIPPAQIDGVDGPVCLIQFQAAENGVYPLTIDGAVLSNVDGGLYNVTTVDGTLTISGVTVEAVANPAEGGTVTGAGVYAIGAAVTMTAFPAEGYAFINWTENGAEITTDASWTFVATANHSFVANFSSVNITVTANPTEGGTVTGGGVYPYGSEVIVNAIPAEGYAFRWWLKDNEIVSTDAFWSFTAVEDLNLVAYFSSINTLSIPTNLIGYVDKPVTVPVYLDNPIDNVYGFQFDIELGDLTYVEGSATVADRTSSNFYIVATVIDGNVLRVLGYSIPPTPVSGTYGDICTFDVMPSAEGNYLLPITNDVLSDEAGNILYSYAPLSGLVIVGAMQEYVINAIANPAEGGTITGAGVYETGDIVTLTATAAEGYTFVNWTDDFDNVISLDNSYTFVVVESRTLIANFVLDVTITVAADPVDGGSVLGGGVYSYGDVVTLIATPAMGYAFMYWMENNISISESPVLSFTATEDRDLVAYFSSVNTLSIPQNLFGYATEEITVPVSLNNPVDDVYGFQFDIELGELTYVDGSAVVTDRTNSNFYIVASVIDNNVLRILGYSIPPTAISGENGVICTFGVTAPEEGYYLLPITNSVLSGMVGNILYSYAPFPGLITVDELAEYTVIVNAIPAEAGTVTGGGVYTQHDIATVTATANDGYTFNYWTNNEGNIVSGDNSFSFTVVEDCVLNANFTVTTVNIEVSTYSTGGIVIGGGLYHVGDMVQLFAIADDCYTFEYWADANGNILSYDNPYSFIAAEDITIFAHFTQASYTVTAWVNPTEGGTITGVSNPYNCGDVATLTAVPAENYSFDGWYSAGALISSDATYSFTVNDNVWLMAQFSIESITITASADPEEYGVVSGAGSYIVGSTVNLIAYPFPGYYFINWTENGAEISTDDTYTFIATVDRTLVAHFAMDSYTVTVNVDPADGGTVTGAGTYIYNDMVTLTATPNGDYQFVNWTDEAGNVVAFGPQYSFYITSDRTFTAHFAIEYYTVTLNVDPADGGTVTGAGTYLLDELVTLTATPNGDYQFVNWTDEAGNVVASGAQYSFNITSDRTFTAHFAIEYHTVTINVDPVEGGTVAGAGTYLLNEFVTLTATVNDGYEFVSWTDENDNVVAFGTQYSFYITNDRVFTAHFVEDGLYPVVSMDIDHENLTAVVNWVPTAGSDPLYYVVCAIQGENSYTSLNTAETTATIKFVEEDTYIIGVAAVYDNGMSDFVTGYVDIEVNEINNFRVSNPSLNIVELTWDPCPSDRFNDFYRYHITGGSAPIDIYNINDTTFTDYLTVPGVYTYCITIEYGPQGIVSTDEICHPITIEQGAMFPAVILNQPIVVNMTADVSWQVAYPLAVEYYNVYIDNVKVGMTSDMSYICKLATEDVHTVSVEAIYEYGTSDRTSSTFINDVNEISNLNISQNFEELTLTWNAPLDTYNDFVYYTITRNGAYLADIYNINETTYTDYIENGNTTYNYCITVSYLASNNNYVVSQPVCKSITVAEIFPPVTYISVDNENLSFLATWPAMPGAVSYTVSGVVDNPVTVVDPQFFGSVDEVALQTITVVVNYAQGSSIPANEEFQISLNAPKNFTAVPNGGDIVMTWGAPNDKYGDLTGYVITRNSEVVATVAAEVLTYTDTPDYGIYEYCVKAQYGYAYYSASDCQSSVAPECPAVTDLYGAFNFNDGTVTLYWTAPTNGTFTYNVYRNNVKIASVDQPTYVDSGINSYDDYVYNISVVCFDGVESNLSNPFSGSFACGGFPVENLRAVYDNAGGQPNVTLTWDKPLDFIDGQVYNIYRQGELIASQYAGTTYVDYVNIPSGTYSYTVTEVCPDGSESLPSTVNVAVETGIDDFNISVNVYPNPTAGDVTIECENMNSITIYNSLGQVVRNISVDANSITVSTSDMSSGVYIFNIINNDGNAIQKRVIVSK